LQEEFPDSNPNGGSHVLPVPMWEVFSLTGGGHITMYPNTS